MVLIVRRCFKRSLFDVLFSSNPCSKFWFIVKAVFYTVGKSIGAAVVVELFDY